MSVKISSEKIILIFFFCLLLFLGPGTYFDHRISHEFPFGYSASDAFQHQVRAESIKEMGNFRYEANYISIGLENTVGRYPPLLYHLAVVFSTGAGIEVYDGIVFILLFFMSISTCIMYYITRAFNKHVALLALPFSLLLFSSPLIGGVSWGHWPSLMAQVFLLLFFWTVLQRNLPQSWLLLGIAWSSVALTHTSENIFAMVFLALYFTVILILRKLKIKDIINFALMGVFFLVVSMHYLIIFKNTWGKSGGGINLGTTLPLWEGGPGFYLAMLGLLLIPLLIGAIISVLKIKKAPITLFVAWSMLIAGFLNYAGFSFRAFQIRFFWPVYLSVFLGLSFFIIGKLCIKKWKMVHTVSIFALLFILISGVMPIANTLETVNPRQNDLSSAMNGFAQHNTQTSAGMMNQYHWATFNWLAENTPEDALLYFFYGDLYTQDAVLRNSKRVHHQISNDDFFKDIQNRKINRLYWTEVPGDTGGTVSYRNSLFSFTPTSETVEKNYQYQQRDICEYDYLIFDAVARQEVLAQYNLLIAQELINNNQTTTVFQNEVSIILKNDNPGADCIDEKTF